MNEFIFSQIDFGPLKEYLENDDITDISYSNNGQLWLKTLSQGIYRVENPNVNNVMMEKLAFQCSNVMGRSFNAAHPFLDSESAELRMNFVHDSIASNGIACVIRKTPAKIRLEKDKLLAEKYITADVHDFLIQCVLAHCNIIVCGETGSGKTEFVKYLASKTRENEKIITIEDTLELHLDKIFPHRDIVAMKTNNVASYSEVLVTCMRQNPKWILLSEVRSAEAVTAVRNSISSGHYILSTIHADKASSIPNRMYSLMENSQDIEQFLNSVYRYIQLGVFVRGRQDKETKRFVREIGEVTEFYVTEDNESKYNVIYRKTPEGKIFRNNPSKYLIDYIEGQGVQIPEGFINPIYDEEEDATDDSEYLKVPMNEQVVKNTTIEKFDQPVNSVEPLNQNVVNKPIQPVNNVVPQKSNVIQQSSMNTIGQNNIIQPNVQPNIVKPVEENIVQQTVRTIEPNIMQQNRPVEQNFTQPSVARPTENNMPQVVEQNATSGMPGVESSVGVSQPSYGKGNIPPILNPF